MIVIGIDPGISGAISIHYENEYGNQVAIHDMPKQVKSVKRKRNKKGEMQNYPSYEVNAAEVAAIIHPSSFSLHEAGHIHIYIEQVGAIYRSDKQGGKNDYQPSSATFAFGQGYGTLLGVCEAYYGKENVTRVAPITWKKHFGLLRTEKDDARIYAINNILIEGVPELLKRKKDGGRADAVLIGHYGLTTEQDKT